MRVPLPLQVLSLAILGAVTVAVTTGALHRPRVLAGVAPTPTPPGISATIVTRLRLPGESTTFTPPLVRDPYTVSSATSEGTRIEVDGKLVHIATRVHLWDSQPDMGYFWWVRVLSSDGKKTLLYEKKYDDQIFIVPQAEDVSPTFEDVVRVPLPAGLYLLEISVCHTPPGGWAALKNPRVAEGCRTAPSTVKLTLTK